MFLFRIDPTKRIIFLIYVLFIGFITFGYLFLHHLTWAILASSLKSLTLRGAKVSFSLIFSLELCINCKDFARTHQNKILTKFAFANSLKLSDGKIKLGPRYVVRECIFWLNWDGLGGARFFLKKGDCCFSSIMIFRALGIKKINIMS